MCHLLQNKINYLGHIFSNEGAEIGSKKVQAIQLQLIPRKNFGEKLSGFTTDVTLQYSPTSLSH